MACKICANRGSALRYPVGSLKEGGEDVAKRHVYEVGKVYGCQTLLGLCRATNGRLMAETQCVYCGRISQRVANSLFREHFNSCVCRNMSIGGLSNSRIYGIYHNMLDRCSNPNCMSYPAYGGKGIYVDDIWSGSDGFRHFYEWSMQHGYADNLTIDRIKNNGPYAPWNCQWITRGENTARANGVQHRKANLGRYYGVSPDGTYIEFDNANEFARMNPPLLAGGIRKCANGNAKTYLGWSFGFVSQRFSQEPQSTIENTALQEVSRVPSGCNARAGSAKHG